MGKKGMDTVSTSGVNMGTLYLQLFCETVETGDEMFFVWPIKD